MSSLKIVNRSSILVKPKIPFLEWLNKYLDNDKQLTLKDIRQDCTVLLVPEVDGIGDTEKYLRSTFHYVFKEYLNEYTEEENEWPNIYDYNTFKSWFDTEEHTLILDSVDSDLIKSEL